MFCKKCGNEISDGSLFCSRCGSSMEAPQTVAEEQKTVAEEPQVVTDPVENDVPNCADEVRFEPSIVLNTEGQTTPRNNKWLIPGLVAASLVLVAAVVLLIFFLKPPAKVETETSLTPEELFVQVNKDYVSSQLNSMSDAMDGWFSMANEDMGYEGEVRVILGDMLLAMLSSDMDLQWLSQFGIQYDVSNTGGMTSMDMEVVLGDTDLTSAQYIMDKENLEMWLMVPDMNKQALYFDLNSQIQNSGSAGILAAGGEALIPSMEEVNTVVMPQVETFLNAFSNIEQAQETVEVEDISQELIVLKAEMSEEELCKTLIQIFKNLKEDATVREYVQSLQTALGEETDLYNEFLNKMDEGIASLEQSLEKIDPEEGNVLYLHTYLDGQNQVVGHLLGAVDNGENQDVIYYVTVRDEEEIAWETRLTDEVRILGSGKEKDTLDATYYVYYQDEKYLKLEYTNYDQKAEFATGTISVTPQEALIEAMTENMDPSAQAIIGMFVVEIKTSGTAQDNVTAITLKAMGMEFVTLEISGEVTEPDAIQIPKDSVDGMDSAQMDQWSSEIDQDAFQDKLIERLAQAGVPAELLFLLGYSGLTIPL